jgi:hypothetical protein
VEGVDPAREKVGLLRRSLRERAERRERLGRASGLRGGRVWKQVRRQLGDLRCAQLRASDEPTSQRRVDERAVGLARHRVDRRRRRADRGRAHGLERGSRQGEPLGAVALLEERLDVERGEGTRDGLVALRASVGDGQVALDGDEELDGSTHEPSRELARALTPGEARAGDRDAQLRVTIRPGEVEALQQSTDEQRDLGALSAAIEVRLVEDEEERLVAVLREPLARLVEDRPLDRPHQHVLEHRVVGDEDVRRRAVVPTVHVVAVELVAGDELTVLRQRVEALVPPDALGPVPTEEV